MKIPMTSISPSLRLIAACCRRADDPERQSLVDSAISSIVDWDMFVHDVSRHRVHGQVSNALASARNVPDSVLAALKPRVTLLKMRSLRQLSELRRLIDILQTAAIPAAEIKGMTVGALAYGTPFVKESADLDILVPIEHAHAALNLLLRNGYRHASYGAALTARQISALIRNCKDVALSGPHNIQIELHWRLSRGGSMLRGAGDPQSWQLVEVSPGYAIPTLGLPELVTYLAVHGSLHNWGRLKWLADFDAIARHAARETRQEWREHANLLGGGRCLDYAFAMSRQIFGPLPGEGAGDGAVTGLTSHCLRHGLRSIAAPYPPLRTTIRQKFENLFDDLAGQLPLQNGLSHLRGLLRSYVFAEHDILRCPLPNRLRFLYLAVRPVLWTADRFKRS